MSTLPTLVAALRAIRDADAARLLHELEETRCVASATGPVQ
jgi:hypothetical protein